MKEVRGGTGGERYLPVRGQHLPRADPVSTTRAPVHVNIASTARSTTDRTSAVNRSHGPWRPHSS